MTKEFINYYSQNICNESKRFLKDVQNLKKIKSGRLHKLNIEVDERKLKKNNTKGIF